MNDHHSPLGHCSFNSLDSLDGMWWGSPVHMLVALMSRHIAMPHSFPVLMVRVHVSWSLVRCSSAMVSHNSGIV